MKNAAEKYTEFILCGGSKSGLTCIWKVINPYRNEKCGEVRWHGAFRKYCFYPTDGFLFDHNCLNIIADFCELKTRGQRESKKRA